MHPSETKALQSHSLRPRLVQPIPRDIAETNRQQARDGNESRRVKEVKSHFESHLDTSQLTRQAHVIPHHTAKNG